MSTTATKPWASLGKLPEYEALAQSPSAAGRVMATHQIEKGIPLPKLRAKYPFAEMEIGDSFFSTESQKRLSVAAVYAKAQTGRQYTVRAVEGGYRVWRVA